MESPRIQGDLETVVNEQKADFNVIVRAWGEFDVDLGKAPTSTSMFKCKTTHRGSV